MPALAGMHCTAAPGAKPPSSPWRKLTTRIEPEVSESWASRFSQAPSRPACGCHGEVSLSNPALFTRVRHSELTSPSYTQTGISTFATAEPAEPAVALGVELVPALPLGLPAAEPSLSTNVRSSMLQASVSA